MIDCKEANRLFEYKEGKLYNKIARPPRAVKGAEAGCLNSSGYKVVQQNKVLYYVHRIVWLMHHEEWPVNEIDHINRIRDDNRVENLRDVTRNQNAYNRGGKGYTYKSGENKPWVARVGTGYKSLYLGSYSTEEEARQAYLLGKEKYHKIGEQ